MQINQYHYHSVVEGIVMECIEHRKVRDYYDRCVLGGGQSISP